MNYQQDGWWVSLLWGRIGAAALLIAALVLGYFGYNFEAPDQQAFFGLVEGILAAVAAILVIISKVRESKKIK